MWGPRAHRSSGHVVAVKSHLIPGCGRSGVCSRCCARRGGTRGGFNRARVTGVERWTSAPMAHGGALPRLLLRRVEEERGGEVGDRMEWRVWGRGVASRPGGGGGRPWRAQCQRTAATWPSRDGARQAPRAGERGGGGRPGCWLGRKGGGSAQQRLSPSRFF